MFALFLKVYEIFAIKEKRQTLTLEMKVKVKELKNETCFIRLKIVRVLIGAFSEF